MIGRAVGSGFAAARDFLARGLVRAGVSPNALTLTGMLLTIAAGVSYALGAGCEHFAWSWAARPGEPSALLLLGACLLVLSSACDMLDGAVARLGGKSTAFGAFLDSTLDRFSDFAVYAGIAVYYARQEPANLTFVLLSMVAFFNAFMISYARARAEDIIEFCTVGYWQRGERSAAILIATFAYNIPALIVQQALLPMLTAGRRLAHTRAVLAGRGETPELAMAPLHVKLRLWRWPRMSLPYDFVTAVNIAWLLFAPVENIDPLRRAIEKIGTDPIFL